VNYTRTHVRWFSEDELAPIRRAFAALRAEANTRRQHLPHEAVEGLVRRLETVTIGIELLAEPVPPELGG
jgi:hypothetical protein